MVFQLFKYVKNYFFATKKENINKEYFLNENYTTIEKNIENNKLYKFNCTKEERHMLYKKLKGKQNIQVYSEGDEKNNMKILTIISSY